MRVAVVGAGAVGLGLSSCLLSGSDGSEVRIVARSHALRRELDEHGLERRGIFGDVAHAPGTFELASSIGSLADDSFDFILVCTKSTDAAAVASELASAWHEIAGPRRVVLCQNGWGIADAFVAKLPAELVYNARVITGFTRPSPASVEITVHADAIRMGSLHGAAVEPLAPLARAIASGGIPCEVSWAIERDLLAKLLYSCALNPLGALLDVPYGVLAERGTTRGIIDNVVSEIFAVLDRARLHTHWEDPTSYLRDFYGELLPATRTHESSMLHDVRAGRPSEIDALCGAVVELGARHGVPTPTNLALVDLLHAVDR